MTFNEVLSLKLIKNDFNDIINLVKFMNGKEYASIFFLGFIPYVSLCLYEGISSIERSFPSIKEDIENYELIKQSRMHVKIFKKTLSKNLSIVENIDYWQHLSFVPKRNKSLGKLNFYYNLGIYFNLKGKMLFNTHLSSYFAHPYIFEDRTKEEVEKLYLGNKVDKLMDKNNPVYKNAQLIGSYLGSISKGIFEGNPTISRCRFEHLSYDIEYKDYNTKTSFTFKEYNSIDRNIILFILHLMSVINFTKYLYDEVVKEDNGLGVRIKYNAYDFVLKSIKQIVRYLETINLMGSILFSHLNEIKEMNSDLLNNVFGTHMRHYGICVEEPLLNESEVLKRIAMPLVGLVEFHYNGMSYKEFELQLDKKIELISGLLDSCILINRNNRKKL